MKKETNEDIQSFFVFYRNNVQFSTAGGLMSNVIYAASNEDTEVLNIKRGILSLLQFPIDTLTSVRLVSRSIADTDTGQCLIKNQKKRHPM